MIKKVIGIIVALAVLGIIVMTALGHTKYKSAFGGKETTENVQE